MLSSTTGDSGALFYCKRASSEHRHGEDRPEVVIGGPEATAHEPYHGAQHFVGESKVRLEQHLEISARYRDKLTLGVHDRVRRAGRGIEHRHLSETGALPQDRDRFLARPRHISTDPNGALGDDVQAVAIVSLAEDVFVPFERFYLAYAEDLVDLVVVEILENRRFGQELSVDWLAHASKVGEPKGPTPTLPSGLSGRANPNWRTAIGFGIVARSQTTTRSVMTSNRHDASPRRIEAAAKSLAGRLVGRMGEQPGAAPGTLVHGGDRVTESVLISMLNYTLDSVEERELARVDECFGEAEQPSVTWVNVDGLHDVSVVEAVGERFGVHSLALEDVFSTTQRPKVEDYNEHFFVVLRMLSFDRETLSIHSEQVSLVVGHGYVFSFQERPGDVFEPVRRRIRQGKGKVRGRGTDYLAYALIDAVVDSYFRILEEVGDCIEDIEEAVLLDPTVEVMHQIHHLRREMLLLRRAVWPLREALGLIHRGEVPNIAEETQVFFRDVYDHAIQVIDTVETLRDVISGAMDLYMSGVSNKMNEVMKVLTIIATIFIPLSFFTGLYGMNFAYMPELGFRYGYPVLVSLMAITGIGMLFMFRRKGWM